MHDNPRPDIAHMLATGLLTAWICQMSSWRLFSLRNACLKYWNVQVVSVDWVSSEFWRAVRTGFCKTRH